MSAPMFMTSSQRKRLALDLVEKGRALRRRERRASPFAPAISPVASDLEHAVAYFSQAIEIEPECWQALMERASVRLQLERRAAAREDALKAANFGMEALGYVELASAFFGDERREFLEKALRLGRAGESLDLIRGMLEDID